MLVTIVVPAYNAAATLEACLDACLRQTHADLEVIVVDDGSTDDTRNIAESKGVRCESQEQAGPAAARNRGASIARGGIIAFTDADCVPHADWVERLLEGFDSEDAGAVGGTYGMINSDRLLPRIIHEEIAFRHARLRREVDFLGSFNIACRREAFEAVGGFDETFKEASGEDNDLTYRMAQAGWRLIFAPEAVVDHHHPQQLGPYLRRQARHGFWRVKLYAKHPKRTGGDRYAGFGDMVAPVLSLGAAALVLVFPAVFWMSFPMLLGYLAAWFFVFGPYMIIRLPMAIHLVLRTRDIRMIEYGDVAFLRDLARAYGMMQGVWRFLVLRKAEA